MGGPSSGAEAIGVLVQHLSTAGRRFLNEVRGPVRICFHRFPLQESSRSPELIASRDMRKRLHEVIETELCPLAERVVKKPGDCPSDACVIGLFSIESSNSKPVVAAQSSVGSHVPTTATAAKGRAVEVVLVLTIILGLSNMLGFLDFAKQERNMAMKMAQRSGIPLTPAKPALSLVMANLAKLGEGDAVLDPCCGTGSLLLAARQCLDCLAICADVAPRSSPSGGGNRAVALRADITVLGPYRPNVVDAIVADPPFGLREDLADGEFSIRDSRTESRCHP